jgi:hypothetical protein
MLKINIPTPCHEDWNAMVPNAQDKHCNACAKTVVDFTSMTDDEVKHFLLNRKDEKLCGRFRNEQLHRITIDLPNNIFYLQMPLWKKYLAAILIVFSTTLFSCDTHLQGEPIPNEDFKTLGGAIVTVQKTDSTQQQIDTIALPMPPKCNEDIKGELQVVQEIYTTGNLAPIPIEPSKQEAIVGKLEYIEDPKMDSAKIDTTRCINKIFL